jgi:hypothetical protein
MFQTLGSASANLTALLAPFRQMGSGLRGAATERHMEPSAAAQSGLPGWCGRCRLRMLP